MANDEWRIRRLLLLFLLLHHVFAVGILKRLENVGAEKRFADVVQLRLRLVQIFVQAAVENFVNGAELQFREENDRSIFGVVAKMPLGHAGNPADGAVQFAHAKAHRAREAVVEQRNSATSRGCTSAP
jgi:uncharacterized membrane protein